MAREEGTNLGGEMPDEIHIDTKIEELKGLSYTEMSMSMEK